MVDVQQNTLSQAGILNNEQNPATGSDRMKAPVVGVGPLDFFFILGGGAEPRCGSGWYRRGGSLGPYCISKDR